MSRQRHFNYSLSPTRLNNAKPKEKSYKLTDGGGLFVQIEPGGAKTWRYQYLLAGKRREVTIGRYPEITVKDARDRHAEYRAMVAAGEDPAGRRKADLADRRARESQQMGEGAFKAFSLRWIAERLADKTEGYRKQIRSRLERFVWPEIGHMALAEVKPAHICPARQWKSWRLWGPSAAVVNMCFLPRRLPASRSLMRPSIISSSALISVCRNSRRMAHAVPRRRCCESTGYRCQRQCPYPGGH